MEVRSLVDSDLRFSEIVGELSFLGNCWYAGVSRSSAADCIALYHVVSSFLGDVPGR
jgi:hypothetical protein